MRMSGQLGSIQLVMDTIMIEYIMGGTPDDDLIEGTP